MRDGRAAGVVLDDGTELLADAVIANTDPRRTLLHLVDPVDLDPASSTKIRNYRMPGTVAKLDFALSALPAFRAVPKPADLRGRVHIGPTIDYLEHAFDASKYGEMSSEPYLDVAFPSILDPSLAPPGRHVMSVYMQFAPYKLADGRNWTSMRDTLVTTVLRTLERYAPGVTALIEGQRVLTPADLETHVRPDRRAHPARGALARPAVHDASGARVGAGTRRRSTGCSCVARGTHPGGGLTAASGHNAAREIIPALKKRRAASA